MLCRNAWGVTPIDSLSTAIIMEEAEIVNQILDFAATIDFTTTQETESEISVFETNIRYLAGLISGTEYPVSWHDAVE
jgi:mannosyl-oligosaccharide alpha-1,2-mannosidase